ncbi:MAG: 2-oxoacid:acceptor oxidoreductase subunit alpha, partial [Gammaproteobacteria bacterium]|nr:2-oxoacid:acceptor oxidoreductase subunit alpha [Gammaproteobacteria bacterium]
MKSQQISEHIVEVVSDSGEGAQKCGQTFGAISGKMGNGVWTVEIIPAEIQPPARSPAGASGIRIRFGSKYMTNMGDEADLVVTFNEQVLYSRIANGAYKPGTVVLLENKWASDPVKEIQEQYHKAVAEFRENGLTVHELPIHEACLKIVANPRKGKNMFVLGMLCRIYNRDVKRALNEIATTFARKGDKVIKPNQDLFNAGYAFAEEQVEYSYEVPPWTTDEHEPTIVTSGNTAVGLGVMAAGMELVSMYPITPA